MATMIAANAAEHQGTPGYWRLVIVLMAIYTYAFIDRMILALLVEPIKAGLGASDVQMSLMLGLAFAALYGILSVPAGHYVDRINRRRMIAIASVGWALMTIICGTANTLPQLFLARMGVGIAEAVLTPAAFSLIRDAVPTRSRGLAFSIFAMSPMIGGATSLIGGAALLRAIRAGAFAGVPLLGGLEPWQGTLIVVGLCGLPFSLLLLTVAEPARAAQSPAADAPREGILTGLVTACRYMATRRSLYIPLVLFASFGGMINFTNGAWLPSAFGRQWQMAPQQVGPALGLLTLVCGVSGLLFAGMMMNRIGRRGGDIRIYGAVAVILSAAGIAGAVLSSTVTAGYVCVGFGMVFLGSSYSVGATTLAEITPLAMMGRVSAVYLLFQNLIGQAMGPLIVALAAANLFSGPTALPHGMALSVAAFALATAAGALLLGRAIRREPAVS